MPVLFGLRCCLEVTQREVKMTPPWPASISDDVVVEHAVYDASSLIIEFVVYLHVAAVVPLSVLLFVACVAISLSL